MIQRSLRAAAAVIGTLSLVAAAPAGAEGRDGNAPADGPASLVDHHGHPVGFDDFLGRFVLVFFGYTHCPDVCPTDLAVLAEALDRLGAPGERVQPLFITVDPERDTVEVMAAYVAHFHPRLIGVTGAPAEIRAVAARYRVGYTKVYPDAAEGSGAAGGGDYLLDHTAASYLVGPDGRVLGLFQHGTPAADIAAAIRPLLDGEPR